MKLPQQLTPRETQVLHFLKEGCSSKDIAQRLKMEYRTVDKVREGLRRKYRVHNTIQLLNAIAR